MNSFIENVNYVAGLDNKYGSGIELYKNNLSLKSVQHDIELKFSYYNNDDKKTHSIIHSEPGVLVGGIDNTLLSFKTLVESSITGSEFTCTVSSVVQNFVINNIVMVNISIVSNSDAYKTYELEMKVVIAGAVTYDVFGEVKDSLKVLPSLGMITASDIDAMVNVYEIQEDVTAVSENIANVETVSDSIANVNTVGISISNINIVGEDIANVNTVSTNILNVDTVSESITNVNTVSSNIVDVGIASTNIASIKTVANAKNLADIIRVADDLNSLDVNGIADITIVSNDLVLGVNSNIIAVSESIDNVNIAGNDIDNINIVGINITDIGTVSTNIANVNITATDISSVNNVSSNIAEVNTVSDGITNVNTVSGSIANVNTVGSNIVGLNSIVSNMTEILLADDNAAIATTKALESSDSRNQAETFAQQASVSALSVDASNIVHRTGDETIDGVKTFTSNIVGNINGNAGTASKLQTARTITLSGDVSGSVSLDGSVNVTMTTTIGANSVTLGTDTTGNYVAGLTQGTGISITGSVGEGWSPTVSLADVGTAGTYRSVTTDAKGRITAGTNPTTVSGYGITDAYTKTEVQTILPKVGFNTTNVTAPSVGQIAWNQDENTLDLGLNGAVLQVGQEQLIRVRNNTASTITNGGAVMATGTIGNSGRITIANANLTQANAKYILGIVTETIANGADGFVTAFGKVRGIQTNGVNYGETWVDGDVLYVKDSGNGVLTKVVPTDTQVKLPVAIVISAHGSNGTLFVRVNSIDENHAKAELALKANLISPTLVTPNIGVATGTSFNSITGLSSIFPVVNGEATIGTSTTVAKADHIHPSDTTKVTKVASTDNAIVRFNGTTGDVQNSAITIDDSGNIGSGTQSFNGFGGSGFKNHIINGNFDIWQRGTSFSNLTNTMYSVDRWAIFDSVGDINYNVIRAAGEFTGGYVAAYTFNSGTGIRSVVQFVENVTRFNVGSKVTVSFEAYTNSTPYTVNVAIQGAKGRWTTSTAEVSSNITLTNSKTRYSVTLTVPDWTTMGIDYAHLEYTALACKFNLPSTTNGKNFIIGNVQLEEGSVATPFENRPYTLELMLCKRYYRKSFGYETAPTQGSSPTEFAEAFQAIVLPAVHRGSAVSGTPPRVLVFDVEMRVAPVLYRYGNSDGLWFFRDSLVGGVYSGNINILTNKNGLSILNDVSSTYNGIVIGHYVANAEL